MYSSDIIPRLRLLRQSFCHLLLSWEFDMNTLFKTAISVCFFVCVSTVTYAERITNKQELDKLSVFISNFTEARVGEIKDTQSFLNEKNADALMSFGIAHNEINNWQSRFANSKCPQEPNRSGIESKYVIESIEKYFGYKLKTLPKKAKYKDAVLKNDCYYTIFADGEMVRHAIVSYAAKNPKNQYIRVSGITYYPDIDEEDYGSLDDVYGVGFFTAEVKPVVWNGKKTYHLIKLHKIDNK